MLHRLIEAHLNAVEKALDQLSDIRVDRYIEEALSSQRMNFRIRIRVSNGNLLEVNEALQIESNILVWVDYRYHYQDAQNQLIFRYDNTPHFPDLSSFPHHKHLPTQVIACTRPELLRLSRGAYGATTMTIKELLLQAIETATEDQLAQTHTYIQTFKQNPLTTSDRSETIEDDLAGHYRFIESQIMGSDALEDLEDDQDNEVPF